MAEEVTNPNSRDRYIISSLIEESVTSSQLEGASTTTDVAKDMIRSGRRPIDRSEQMIFNNYRGMRFVQSHSKNPLTPELVFELHRIVTADTLDEPGKAGRFRGRADNIVVEDPSGHVLHVPPDAKELSARLDAMCAFANDRPDDVFLHPVIRSIILHFWLGYDHPFVDGNGRTARALFYWSMLSQNYWLTEFLSISQILKRAPAQYSRSFVYTETDENDLTYFILHQLRVISRAIDTNYLRRKMQEVRQVQSLLKQSGDLNHRQLALLSHAFRHPDMNYTIQSHQTSHNVVYQTARTDLLDLVDRGLLVQRKVGKAYAFVAPTNLGERLSASAAPRRTVWPAAR
jgi:Fic family protein